MKKIGLPVPSRDLNFYRKVNSLNTSKTIKISKPEPNIYATPINDRREYILNKIRVENFSEKKKDDRESELKKYRKIIN